MALFPLQESKLVTQLAVKNHLATKVQLDNIVPNFYSYRWFKSSTMGTGSFTPLSDTKVRLDLGTTGDGVLCWIPVELGETYTFSGIVPDGALFRIYRDKVTSHVSPNLVASTESGNTFTVTDGSFNGYITIRLTSANIATYIFENIKIQKGTVATPINKTLYPVAPSPFQKAPSRIYPFVFTRDSVEIIDGVRYGYGIPRMKDNGVIVEEAVINLLPRNLQLLYGDIGGWDFQYNGSAVSENNLVKVTAAVDDLSRIRAANAASVTAGNTYTYTVWAKAGTSRKMTLEMSNPTTKVTFDLTDELRPYNLVVPVNLTGLAYLYIYAKTYNTAESGDIYVEKAQVEQNSYGTSFTSSSRAKEMLQLMSGSTVLDSEAGSIEMDLIPQSCEGLSIGQPFYGLHDIVYYTQGYGFIVRRNYNYANRIEFITTTPGGGVSAIPYSYAWKNGELLRYRVEWDRTAGYFNFYLNDELVVTTSTVWRVPGSNVPLQFGCRGMITERYGNNNAVITKCIIKDRNGNVTFQF